MNFSQFEARVMLWPAIPFTTVIKTRYDDQYEIYLTNENSNIKTQLFLCFAENEHHANLLIKQYMLWLIKINSQKRRQRAAPGKVAALAADRYV